MNKILIVEDDLELAGMVVKILEAERCAVDHAKRAQEAREFLFQYTYDLIILDLHLPDGDGRELCRELRKNQIGTPILILTGQDSTPEIVSGLDSGSDDYLTKPFESAELLARLRALNRRDFSRTESLKYGNLELQTASRTLKAGGKVVELARREFDLLAFLICNPEQNFDVESLKTRVWGNLSDVNRNAVMTAISRLRSKLDEANGTAKIKTVSAGYRLSSD